MFWRDSCGASPQSRRKLRSRIREAVDLEFRLWQEEQILDSHGLRGSASHLAALLRRRQAIVMVGIRDNLPWLHRDCLRRYTRLSPSPRAAPPRGRGLAGFTLCLFFAVASGSLAYFAASGDDRTALRWFVVFAAAQLLDAVVLVPFQILLQSIVLPSLLRDLVSLAKLGRIQPTQTLAILLRNNADVIEQCPALEVFVPLSVALWEARAPPGVCDSPLYVQQRYVFEDAKKMPVSNLAIAEWLPGPALRDATFASGSDSESERRVSWDSGRLSSSSDTRASSTAGPLRGSADEGAIDASGDMARVQGLFRTPDSGGPRRALAVERKADEEGGQMPQSSTWETQKTRTQVSSGRLGSSKKDAKPSKAAKGA
eukprot:scaffold7626_cov258-Pinguiococcus_pyrenoidosus.AAC.1